MTDFLMYFVVIMVIVELYALLKISNMAIKLTNLQEQYMLQAQLLENLQFNEAQLVDNNEQLSEKLTAAIVENEQVTNQLNHRTKTLQQRIDELKEMLEQASQQQPEDKLYSRASKLVKLGADVEEVMRECELPRAEAELLISMHLK